MYNCSFNTNLGTRNWNFQNKIYSAPEMKQHNLLNVSHCRHCVTVKLQPSCELCLFSSCYTLCQLEWDVNTVPNPVALHKGSMCFEGLITRVKPACALKHANSIHAGPYIISLQPSITSWSQEVNAGAQQEICENIQRLGCS